MNGIFLDTWDLIGGRQMTATSIFTNPSGLVLNWSPTSNNYNDSVRGSAYVYLAGRMELLDRNRRDTWFLCP
jgi:hypothetical protein